MPDLTENEKTRHVGQGIIPASNVLPMGHLSRLGKRSELIADLEKPPPGSGDLSPALVSMAFFAPLTTATWNTDDTQSADF